MLFRSRPLLRSAVPLISMAFGASRVIAPSIAGFMIAAVGAPPTFLLCAAAVCVMAGVLFVVSPAQGVTRAHGSLIGNFTENLRYIRADEVFARTIITALLHSTLAMGFVHVLPVFAKDLLHVDARGLGILASAAGVGALIGFGSHAWFQQFLSWRNLLLGSLVVYNLTLIVLAFSTWYWVSFAAIFVSGICHGYFLTCAQVMLQTMVDDNYRGRVMGVFSLVWSLMFLSGFLLNAAGAWVGPRFALAGGAMVMLVYLWLSLARAEVMKKVVLTPKPK